MTYSMHFVRPCSLALVVALAGCGGDPSATTTETTGADPGSSGDAPTTEGSAATADTTGGSDAITTSAATTADTTAEPGTTTATTATTGDAPVWQLPACDKVTGTGAVTFSADQGATLAPMDQTIVPVTYTWGLVALGEPGAMLASSKSKLLASSDAGCSWHEIGDAGDPNSPTVILTRAGLTRAYGYGDNGVVLVRVDDEQVTALKSPAGDNGIVGLGVDPTDPDRVRIGDSSGRLWESSDGGGQWSPIGVPALGIDTLAYRVAFDPQDLDHVVVGALADGVLTSFDGGGKWGAAKGLGPGKANGFNLVVSPAQGDIVWVEGLDLADPNDATSRHIWRSADGGLTFAAVVDAADATLYNGNHLFAHPVDADILYFVFGSNYADYGTDLYRYDHVQGAITQTHNKWHDAVVEFSPADPSFIYLGLSIEPLGG